MKKYFLFLAVIGFITALPVSLKAQDARLSAPSTVSVVCGKDATFAVAMNNNVNINSFQMDISLPSGLSIPKEIDADDELNYAFSLTYRKNTSCVLVSMDTNRNAIMVAAYHSNVKQYFKNNSGDLVNVKLHAETSLMPGNYNIKISNISFGDMQGKAIIQPDDIYVSVKIETGTGIESVVSESDDSEIFDLSGRKLQTIPQSGIYIRNDKKILVR